MTSPVDIRPDHLEIVQDILIKNLPAGVKVWVFGSRANWTTKDSSDLDLALEGEGKLSHTVLGALKDAFEDSSLPYTVDVVDFNRIGDAFKQIVELQRTPLPLDRVVHYGADLTGTSGEWDKTSLGGIIDNTLYRPTFPEHWKRCPLYSMAKWVNGLAFRNIAFSASGMPIIKIAEIKNGISNQTKFTQRVYDETVRIRNGDLLFSWSGQPETSIDAYWWRGSEGWLNQHVFKVTALNDILTEFLYYLLKYLRPNFVEIARNKQTTGLGHVTKRDLKNIAAAFPPLPEQRAIAHILGTLDDKIELNRRMNETLEAIARALFKSWFVDFDPVRAKMEGRDTGLPPHIAALFPDHLVSSDMGEIPEGWGAGCIGQIVQQRKEKLKDGKATALSAVASGELVSSDDYFTKRVYSKDMSKYLVVEEWDIAYNPARINIGSIGMLKEPVIGAVSPVYVVARPQPAYRWYIDFLLNRPTTNRWINVLASGSVRQSLSYSAFASIPCVIPTTETLSEFDERWSSFRQAKIGRQDEVRTLSTLRDTLLPKLISGEIRVSDAKSFLERAL